MSSKRIYPQTTPYFYIIQSSISGKRYAGCRYGESCHPSELLTLTGYQTSSESVKESIKDDGIESFNIVDIITEDEIMIPFGWNTILDFETWFLRENDCASSKEWINKHNNSEFHFPFGSAPFKRLMVKLYGVDNVSKNDEIKKKKVKTCRTNYGVDYPAQSDVVKNLSMATSIERYGVAYPMQNPQISNKAIQNKLEKNGGEFPKRTEEHHIAFENTMLEKYGVANAMFVPEFKDKMKSTMAITMGDPEWKKRHSDIQSEVQNRPEERARNSRNQKIAQNRPEVKAAKSKMGKGKRHVYNPETGERKRVLDVDEYLNLGWKLGLKIKP